MHLQYMTGLDEQEIADLAELIENNIKINKLEYPAVGSRSGLDMQDLLVITLIMLRHNLTEQVVGDMWGISQPTVYVIKSTIEQLAAMALAFIGITLGQAVLSRALIVDGTFVPTGNRTGTGHANYSGKRHCQCLSIQVACDLKGRLIATSNPVPGARNDAAAIALTGWQDILRDGIWLADCAYSATNARTPIKKPHHRQLHEVEKECNHTLAHIRSAVEHCNATLKQWQILRTGYRRPLSELPLLIALVTQLELFRQGW